MVTAGCRGSLRGGPFGSPWRRAPQTVSQSGRPKAQRTSQVLWGSLSRGAGVAALSRVADDVGKACMKVGPSRSGRLRPVRLGTARAAGRRRRWSALTPRARSSLNLVSGGRPAQDAQDDVNVLIFVALVDDAPVPDLEAPLPLLRRELPKITSGWVFDETCDSLNDVDSVRLGYTLQVFLGSAGVLDGPARQRRTCARSLPGIGFPLEDIPGEPPRS